MKKQKRLSLFRLSSKDFTPLNIFWFGFLIYALGFVINTTNHVNTVIFRLVQAGGIILFLLTGAYLSKFKIKNSYLKTIFIIYCLWLFSVVCRGIRFDYASLNEMFFGADYGLFIYFTPLIILFPSNPSFYKKIFDAIVIFGIFFIIYDVLFIRDLLDRTGDTQEFIEHFGKSLSIPCGFILLTYKYHSKKRIIFTGGVMILTLLFSIYKARRGLSSICLSILMFSYLLYLINTKKKLLVFYLSFLIIFSGLIYVNSVFHIKKNGLFSFIADKGNEDTRTGVELFFYDDMKTKDWIIGRGINGEYFCPGVDELDDYRVMIETGYLQIILKGGIISLALYLLIAIPAVILGIFYSKNILSKASAIWILISLISLYPATVNTFSLAFLLVWVSIGICYSKKIRCLSDDTLKELFDDSSESFENTQLYFENKKLYVNKKVY